MENLAAHDPSFWQRLERLRSVFLSREGTQSKGGLDAYWQSAEDLAAYDVSFGRRIAKKWEFALASVPSLPHLTWVDWGCGSGVASELLYSKQPESVEGIEFYDHSHAAREFARNKLEKISAEMGVDLPLENVERASFAGKGVLMSHVINELSASQRTVLHDDLKGAKAILWVESGSKSTSRLLSEMRDQMLMIASRDEDPWTVLFPCPDCAKCGMLADPDNAAHWCHFFASGDSAWHQSPVWSEFSTRMKIDLRSLPLSAFAMVRTSVCKELAMEGLGDDARIIGKPRMYKGYSKILSCSKAYGVREVNLDKRSDKNLFKTLGKFSSKDSSLTRLQWKLNADGTKIDKGELK